MSMLDRSTGARVGYAGTPVPRRETVTRGTSKVVEYQLTPEELEAVRAKYPATPQDKKFTAPIEIKTKPKEDEDMNGRKEKQGPSCGLTKKVFLEQIAKGETIASIEKAWGMKYNTLTFWVKKWGLRGITPGKARTLLEGGVDPASESEQPLLREKDVSTCPAAEVELLNNAKQEIEQLKVALRQSAEQEKYFETKYSAAESERVRLIGEVEYWKAEATETVALSGQANEHLTAEIERLTAERDELQLRLDYYEVAEPAPDTAAVTEAPTETQVLDKAIEQLTRARRIVVALVTAAGQ